MDNKKRNFAIGTLIAAGVGYLAGILTAPKSGKETRQDIQDAGEKAKLATEKKLKDVYADLNVTIDDAKQNLSKLTDKAKKELNNSLDHADKAKQKAREILSALHDGMADDKDLDRAVKDINDAIDRLKIYLKRETNSAK